MIRDVCIVYYLESSSVYGDSSEGELITAFDNNLETFFTIYSNTYTGDNFSYEGSFTTSVESTAIFGEWLQITLPSAISIDSFSIGTRKDYMFRFPSSGILLGSNDGSTFEIITTTRTDGEPKFLESFLVGGASKEYSTYRFICTATSGDTWLSISEFYVTPSSTRYDTISLEATSFYFFDVYTFTL